MDDRRSGRERRSGTDRRSNWRAAVAVLHPPDLWQDLGRLLDELAEDVELGEMCDACDSTLSDVDVTLWIERCRAVVDRARA